jgi:hypothetical protein
MGYVLKDIATITEPARVSLAGVPNFIQVASKTTGGTAFSAKLVPMPESISGETVTASGYYNAAGTFFANASFRNTGPVIVDGLDFVYVRARVAGVAVSPAVFYTEAVGYISGVTADIFTDNIFKIAVPPGAFYMISSTAASTVNDFFIGLYNAVEFEIQDGHGGTRVIQGTTDAGAVAGLVFYLSIDPLETAENLKAALLNDPYLAANYSVYSDIDYVVGASTVDGVIITALDLGPEFNLSITATGGTVVSIAAGTVSDTIRGALPIVGVFVDLYAVEDVDRIETAPPSGSLGEFVVTLSKSYNGVPAWFDLNRIFAQSVDFTPPPLGFPGVGA